MAFLETFPYLLVKRNLFFPLKKRCQQVKVVSMENKYLGVNTNDILRNLIDEMVKMALHGKRIFCILSMLDF